MFTYIYICVFKCLGTYIHTHSQESHKYIHNYMYVYIQNYLYVCVYIYMFINMYMGLCEVYVGLF